MPSIDSTSESALRCSSVLPTSVWRLVYRPLRMWPGPGSWKDSRARFQWTTCQPPVPRATVPVSWGSTYARSGPQPRSTSTRWRPGRSSSTRTTSPVRNDGMARSETADEALDAIVAGLERVLAQHGALGLVIELQVDPVDGVVTLAFLGP